LSTVSQSHLEPAWKQEVNRRIAAHKNRKGGQPAPAVTAAPQAAGSSRAAQAAARVAARFAKAPTYSDIQAEETRVAVRAAEIATQVALEAQAVAETALAEMHAAATETLRGPAVIESITRTPRVEPEPDPEPLISALAVPASFVTVEETFFATEEAFVATEEVYVAAPPAVPAPEPPAAARCDAHSFAVRWEPDLPVRNTERPPAPVEEDLNFTAEDWWTPAQVTETLRNEPIEVPSQSAHANLIEFPREIVATRKMRPRLAEAAAAPRTGADGQLSIFEVDPGAVSTEPDVSEPMTVMSAAHWVGPQLPGPQWSGPEWSGIELDAHPVTERQQQLADAAKPASRVAQAPLGLRLMALVVDGALILSLFLAAAMFAVAHMPHPPVGKPGEIMAALGLVFVGLFYHALFCAFAVSTPGTRYAGIALSTFNDDSPTREQLRRRFGAMILSLVPVGLGIAWAIFDEDHLSWHDRISQTYLRKR
jgi:uncharacterized RDD family membrane protein YckC